MYIVKPSDQAQGKGIFFATEYEQITKALKIENGQLPKQIPRANLDGSPAAQPKNLSQV
jgi:hypothetical protein